MSRILRLLLELGFSEKTFSEVIAVTRNNDVWNCSPLGVKLDTSRKMLYFYVYEGARILRFFKSKNVYFTINIVSNCKVFFNCIFKKNIPKEIGIVNENLGFIKSADAYVICKTRSLRKMRDNRKYLVETLPKKVVVLRKKPRTFNRVTPAIIEALIYYTKIKPYYEMRDYKYVNELLQRITYCRDVVYHSTTDSEFRKAIDLVLKEAFNLVEKLGGVSKRT